MDDVIFLKHNVDVSGDGRGECGGYQLGALFCVKKENYDPENEYQKVRRLHDGINPRLSMGWRFSVMTEEVEVVNNDTDLNNCIEYYRSVYE